MSPSTLTPDTSASAAPALASTAFPASRRMALSLALLAAGLGGCGDASPVAPAHTEPLSRGQTLPAPGVMLGLVDDATSRLLGSVEPDSPIVMAFTSLRTAVAHGSPALVLDAVDDAELALAFSQAAQRIDEADRDALMLQLQVLRAQVTLGGR